MTRTRTGIIAVAAIVTAATGLSVAWSMFEVPFAPNSSRFDAAARYVLSAPVTPGGWDREVKLPWRQAWLTKGNAVAVFEYQGHKFLFFPQSQSEPSSYSGYFFSVDGADPGEMLVGAQPVAARWWSGALSAQFLAGG